MVTLVNNLRLRAINSVKNAVVEGSQPGQYTFTGDGTGSQSV
jgi:hypothetical protein